MKRCSHLVHGWLTEAFPDGPVYSEALHTAEDVLYSGSEDEAYNSPTERRERYEHKGQRFLQGKPLMLLSASLRGPFTKESGWSNPWRSNTTRKSQPVQSTPARVQEESVIIAATPTILESYVHDAASPRPNTRATPHRYLDDETLYEIKTWQDTVANQPGLDDPFDENTYKPISPSTLKSLQVEITPRTHGSRSIIVSSSIVAEEAVEDDPVENSHKGIVEQHEVNIDYGAEEEAGFINVDEEDDSSLTDLDEEQIEELSEEQEVGDDEEGDVEDDNTGEDLGDKNQEQSNENQQASEILPAQAPSDYDSPTKRPVTSHPLPQPHGKLDLRPREDLDFLPLDTVDLSPTAVKIYEESLRGSTCYSPSWRTQERRKHGNLLPGLVGAAQSPSSRSSRSVHAPASASISHYQTRSNKNGRATLEHQAIEPEHMLVDNQPSEPEETKDLPNEPSDVPAHHQQITVAQPEIPQPVISTTDLPQPNAAVTHTAPEMTEGEQKSHTTDPTSPSSSEISSPATSFEEEEEEPIGEPVETVRKLLWPKTQRRASTQESTPDMALGITSATAGRSQNGSVSESVEDHGGQGSLEYNGREPTKVEHNVLNSQSPMNPEPNRTQLSVIASQALAQAAQPVIQQSPWAKGDSQITALAAPAPEPRFFNPVSSPLSSPASSSCFVDMEDSVLPVLSDSPVPGNNAQTEEDTAVLPVQAQTPQAQPPHPPSTPETKRSSLPTPEFTMSIKSFKHFMTPSPKRPAKRPRLSLGDGRLPDTQALEEAVVTNPWDSSRVEAGTMAETAVPSAPSRKNKRVSWAPLPGEADYVDPDMLADMDVDMEDPDQLSSVNGTKNHRPRRSILSTSASISNYRGTSRRAASPPPSISVSSIDSLPKESQKFGKHFAAVSSRRRLAPKPPTATPIASWGIGNGIGKSPMLRDVSGNARSTGTSRLAKRLLPSESQQTCGSPAVDGMANAFVQADRQVENLNFNSRQQGVQDGTFSAPPLTSNRGIWQDSTDRIGPPVPEQQQKSDDGFRLPKLPGFDSQPRFEETDEVSEVMDNLDDFIDSWDIDDELAQARGEKGKKRAQQSSTLGQGLSSGLVGQGLSSGLGSGRNLWDSPSSRPNSTLKRKRTGDDEEDAGNTGGGGGGGGVYDPGVWDRIV
ncbi:hypothetical protein N0V85_004828 [Neurospora sp. IMI 360204]|nr:hypothetical protein N0V85_004828 [Neurospora sp. IMI 360204]